VLLVAFHSLFSKLLEAFAKLLDSLRCLKFSSEDLAHHVRSSNAAREPPELEFFRADFAVAVEVEIGHHVL
jgi:hypothetical protein